VVELPRPVLLHHLGLEDEVVVAVDWWELDRTVEPDHLTSLYIPAFVPGRRKHRRKGVRGTGRPHGHAAPALSVGLGPDPRLAHAPPRGGELRGARCAGRAPRGSGQRGWNADGNANADTPDANADDAYAHLQEELGDLLFQIVFHARLADEEGQFNLADVARGVHDKLVHRHPHVFGDVEADTAEQVVTNWEAIKKTEKGRRSVTEGIPAASPR
jgi:tetrapyrrole methylase family protein/MazG family protein